MQRGSPRIDDPSTKRPRRLPPEVDGQAAAGGVQGRITTYNQDMRTGPVERPDCSINGIVEPDAVLRRPADAMNQRRRSAAAHSRPRLPLSRNGSPGDVSRSILTGTAEPEPTLDRSTKGVPLSSVSASQISFA